MLIRVVHWGNKQICLLKLSKWHWHSDLCSRKQGLKVIDDLSSIQLKGYAVLSRRKPELFCVFQETLPRKSL